MKLLFTRSSTIPGALIRAFDGGTADHVAIELRSGAITDTSFLQGGVGWHVSRESFLGTRRKLVHEMPVEIEDELQVEQWLRAQTGKKYDWTALVGFALWRDWAAEDSWYCSEYAMSALRQGGWTLADRHTRIGVRLLREVAFARNANIV